MRPDEELNDAPLRELAQRLGARAAARLDVERTAQAVVMRLREAPRVTAAAALWTQRVWLRVAAALVLLVGVGLVVRRGAPPPTRVVALVEPAGTEVSELSAEQLRELLQAVGQSAGDQDLVAPQDLGLEDLSAPQLRALLESLEG